MIIEKYHIIHRDAFYISTGYGELAY